MRQENRILIALVWTAALCSGFAVGRWRSDTPVLLSAFQVIFAVLAFIGAVIAVKATWPQYVEWRKERLRKPDIRMWLETAPNPGVVPTVVGPDHRIVVGPDQGTVIVKVAISNGEFELGTNERAAVGTLHGAILNVAVPTPPLDLRTIDPPAKTHYRSVLLAANDGFLAEWYGGQPTPAAFSVGRSDLGPGHHVYHVEIFLPDGDDPGPWPIKIELDGDPEPPLERGLILAEIHRMPDTEAAEVSRES